MRIVRPGSVVGPQQQYMYLKQLEWAKWAAVDEMRKVQAQAAIASSTLVTPATPPAELDDADAMEDVQHTPTTDMQVSIIPPVTPSRHVAEAAAKARAIVPPIQPRKTPTTKRVHVLDSDEEGSSSDVLPALGTIRLRRPRKSSNKGVTTSEARPTRVTRSTAVAALVKKSTKPSASTPAAPLSTQEQPPNKIPRLTTTRSAANAKAGNTVATSKPVRPPPSTPSRLPTLALPKRPLRHAATNSEEVAKPRKETPRGLEDVVGVSLRQCNTDNAWMKNNPGAVVAPEKKTGRPGLRPIRRRRSSFNSADVAA